MATAAATTGGHHSVKWYQHLYVQVLIAITAGILLGHFYPQLGEQMKPLGDAFIKCIKMIIAPIIFFTVVHGIASMRDMKTVGRVGLKALIYFEVLTTAALIIGLIVINLWKPVAGMNIDLSTVDTKSIAAFTAKAKDQGTVQFLMDIIPSTVVGAFANGEILQVLFVSVLVGTALSIGGARPDSVLLKGIAEGQTILWLELALVVALAAIVLLQLRLVNRLRLAPALRSGEGAIAP